MNTCNNHFKLAFLALSDTNQSMTILKSIRLANAHSKQRATNPETLVSPSWTDEGLLSFLFISPTS